MHFLRLRVVCLLRHYRLGMQIRDFRERSLDGFLKTFRHLVHSCPLKALFRYSFMNQFLTVPKRAMHVALAADSRQMGRATPVSPGHPGGRRSTRNVRGF